MFMYFEFAEHDMICMLLTTKQRQGGALLLGIQLLCFLPGFSICFILFQGLGARIQRPGEQH